MRLAADGGVWHAVQRFVGRSHVMRLGATTFSRVQTLVILKLLVASSGCMVRVNEFLLLRSVGLEVFAKMSEDLVSSYFAASIL